MEDAYTKVYRGLHWSFYIYIVELILDMVKKEHWG